MKVNDHGIKRVRYNWHPLLQRCAFFVAYLLGIAECVLFVATLGFYYADWRATWIFSGTYQRLCDGDL